jgi:hypothetical protein
MVWLSVYQILTPGRGDVDPYFRQAYKSIERQITGITDSAISSNAWKPWFVKALKERPELQGWRDVEMMVFCDACEVKNRYEISSALD